MATLVLTAVGTAIGGPIGGALGALIGRGVDQAVLFKPKGREGPRLAELQVQTSTYGSQVPKLFGTMRAAGTVIWATDLRETKQKSGGGKGKPSVTTYSYSASFAVALSARAAQGIGRIWADGNLLRGAGGDFKTAVGAFRFHGGSEDQAVDPLIAAAEGVALTPAHRGMAYAVFEDLALADYGNRIPSLTFEVIADAGAVDAALMIGALSGGRIAGAAGAAIGGYAAGGGDVRGAIEPLMDSRGWLLREAGGGLAIDAGVDMGAVIGAEGLAARLNGRAAVPVQRSRAPAETVPVRLAMRHYAPDRDYQAGVQKAVRPGPGRREASVDLPEVMAAGAARTMAHDRLAARWAARRRIALRCGWDALVHAPGTILTVEDAPGRWRIAEMEWEAMGVLLTLEGQPGGSVGALPASGGAGVTQPDVPHGATVLMLADLPVLSDAPPSAPVVVAAAAGESEGWRRAALFTVTPGTGEAVPAGGTAPTAAMGTVAGATGDASALLFDMMNSIEVEMLADGMALHPADDAALLNGANLCLVGHELIQFGSAVQTGARSYRLSRLLRGRRGTEWAIAGHGVGEPLLMIDQDRLAAVPAEAVHAGTPLSMLAIGIGDAVPAEAALTVTGEALIPLPPVHVAQEADGAGGVSVRWTRRSRGGWRWMDGVDAPLGEESERYALRLMDGGVEVRRAETGAPLWTYDAAMAVADAAAGHGGPLSLEIRQVGALAAGRAATAQMNG
jgi:hypothetical protein